MKYVLSILAASWLLACNPAERQTKVLNDRIDQLEQKLAQAYKPGFGEFMSGIQAHHAKLWFAGKNQNWPLADFEVHEIMEALKAIQDFQPERKESQLVGTVFPAIDSVALAIEKEDPARFLRSYTALTAACNNCHRATDFGFNVVKIPDLQPFGNQDFRLPKPPSHDGAPAGPNGDEEKAPHRQGK